jgi:hypothetical protein
MKAYSLSTKTLGFKHSLTIHLKNIINKYKDEKINETK